jgi:DNA-directed RNA polymerase subunit RPC12/RpoP
MLKEQVHSKNLFSAFRADRNLKATGPSENEYYCHECGQQFAAYWSLRANRFNSWIPRGSFVVCPYCGHRHERKILTVDTGEFAPFSLAIKLYAFKSKVILTVDYAAQAFAGQNFRLASEQGKETFTFDFSAHTAHFQKTVRNYFRNDKPYEKIAYAAINEFTIGEIAKNSILRHLNACSYLYEDKNVSNLLKALYKTMKSRLQAEYGQVTDLYVNTRGLCDGLFLRALFNYAYKTRQEKAIARTDRIECREKLLWLNTHDLPSATKREITARQSIGADTVTAAAVAAGLPDKKALRQIIAAGGNIALLRRAVAAFENFDYALRFYRALEAKGYACAADMGRFAKYARKIYDDKEIVAFCENADRAVCALAKDILRLYSKLEKGRRRQLLREKVRIGKLHDWLVKEYNAQKDDKLPNIQLSVPKHIARRLAMQLDQIKFFLPNTSKDLLQAGRELHNCVATYADRINRRKAAIVLMADEKGKLIACINVAEKTIVEAKLPGNRPVSTDRTVNKVILDWSQKAGLEINTNDVAVPGEENLRTLQVS